MTAVARVAGPVERMLSRRQELLGKLTSAVDGVGELYTNLLELSATTDLPLDVALRSGADTVSDPKESLDAIRGAFTELAMAARNTAERFDSPGRP